MEELLKWLDENDFTVAELMDEYEIVRGAGGTNMFDRNGVFRDAYEFGCEALYTLIEKQPKLYAKILGNFSELKAMVA